MNLVVDRASSEASKTARDVREIEMEVDDLHKTIEELGYLSVDLIDQLRPVINNGFELSEGGAEKQSERLTSTPLGGKISDMRRSLRYALDRLNLLKSHIEL
ncbi:MAG: hypothetical protein CML16_14870 [Pusillimonas sp.]|nr:hypothetical protein [Pusillimonas sp.]MBC42815.1 hypothetical protein [Pusillimonas sp.]HCP79409.1 hypothetical protein [Pusillimonas sp.]|tara:strand:- start:256 stop:561 length:306 start_codon:yes stop_codon:yes gene_type:complete